MEFKEQVKKKRKSDQEQFTGALWKIYRPLENREKFLKKRSLRANMEEILAYFGKTADFPEGLETEEEMFAYLMEETGIMKRSIVLSSGWYKQGSMPLLCRDKNSGESICLVPDRFGNYRFCDGEKTKVTGKNEGTLEREAFCLYASMEAKSMGFRDFWKFMLGSFTGMDLLFLLSLSFFVGLLGLLLPMIHKFIFDEVIPSGTGTAVFPVGVLLLGASMISELFLLSRTIWIMRIGNKLEIRGKNAVYARLLTLPASFFQEYEAGELTGRAGSIDDICDILGGPLIGSVLGAVFSVLYLFQIAEISPSLFPASVAIVLCMLAAMACDTYFQVSYAREEKEAENRVSSVVFQLVRGMTKIKLCHAEARAFSKWAEEYAKMPQVPRLFLRISGAVSKVITILGSALLYWNAYRANLDASDYIAFQSAFGGFCAAVIMLGSVARQIASLRPSLEMLRPILSEEPEKKSGRKQVEALMGQIEFNRVSFRYRPDMPFVLKDLSIHIRAGEYVGIVGGSGSGKSTMMRILLGFERPESGSVYYDGQDIVSLDLPSLRRRMGVVLQNGKLFSGDIYSNIVVNAPWLTLEDAWEAARASGFSKDIEDMPMGMFTMLSEDGEGISGGQKQRLLIARALVSDPDILLFDEATSALDNITQALVVKTLEERRGTRIVIAHRLSTIMNCDRILYLHEGRVAEEGTYGELMEKKGKFYELARRQLISDER